MHYRFSLPAYPKFRPEAVPLTKPTPLQHGRRAPIPEKVEPPNQKNRITCWILPALSSLLGNLLGVVAHNVRARAVSRIARDSTSTSASALGRTFTSFLIV